MTKKEFLALLDKYLAGEISYEEEKLLSKFYSTYRQEEELDDSFFSSERKLEILTKIKNHTQSKKYSYFKWSYWAAAAIILLISISGIRYFIQNNNNIRVKNSSIAAETVLPGSNRALLKLANGNIISLDNQNSSTQILLKEKGLTIQKSKNGQLIYIIQDVHAVDLTGSNTIQTPRGGQYEVLLPDGTHVWLNSESSLSYNLDFKRQRKVTLTGEAYFEVTKNKIPFIVQNELQEIRVLGTHFNVNSYKDEAYSQTTLLEGQILISSLNSIKEQAILVKPNFKVVTNKHSGITQQSIADTESIMAWKNGDFLFEDTELSTILRVIARWYDVKVDYNSLPSTRYTLQISKNVKLSEVLDMLEKTGAVKFQFQQQTITAVK